MDNNANTRQRVINLFAGPGAGKSTGAAYVFSQLKMRGINCELVQEYAKERVWQNDLEVFNNQLYVIGKQSFRMSRLRGKVDVIITDSPIMMGSAYTKNTPYHDPFYEVLKIIHQGYDNFNCFIERVKPYNPKGRFQDEDGAKKLDDEIKTLLTEVNYNAWHGFNGDQEGYDKLINSWLHHYNIKVEQNE